MKHAILILFLLSTLAAGCGPATPAAITSATPKTGVSPTSAASTTSLPTRPPATATPMPSRTLAPFPTTVPSRTPAPTSALIVPVLSGTQIAADCASFPGFPTCGKNLPLTGRLALFDATNRLARIFDFGTKLAIEVKTNPATHVEWLDQGNYLISIDAKGNAALVWANPVLSKTVLLPQVSVDGTPVFSTADGSTAWLDAKYAFHVLLAGSSKEQVWPAEALPSDKIHQLLGWVPGSPLLLAGYHFGANSMWVTGNWLYTLDARSGVVRNMNASLWLGDGLRWHPTQVGLMAYGDSYQSQFNGAPRLAVLDVTNGKPSYLTGDEAITSSYASWTADGKAVIFAAHKVGAAPLASDPFALAGIYLTSYPAGPARRLTQPPAGARDNWPQMLADGTHFLYLRTVGEGQPAELRLGSLDGSLDGLVASGLSQAPAGPNGVHWEGLIAYAP